MTKEEQLEILERNKQHLFFRYAQEGEKEEVSVRDRNTGENLRLIAISYQTAREYIQKEIVFVGVHKNSSLGLKYLKEKEGGAS